MLGSYGGTGQLVRAHVHREVDVSLDELIQTKNKASPQGREYSREGPLSSGRNYFLIPKEVVEMENVGNLPKNHLFI